MSRGDAGGEWRVDVRGYPVTVIGKYAHDHLQKCNLDMTKMKMALHRIAACQSHHPDDVVAIAQNVLKEISAH